MITEYGKKQVLDELHTAERDLAEVQRKWYEKAHRVRQLQRAAICDHSELEEPGIAYIYMITVCHKCKFRWYD